jgi:hypothetical protein
MDSQQGCARRTSARVVDIDDRSGPNPKLCQPTLTAHVVLVAERAAEGIGDEHRAYIVRPKTGGLKGCAPRPDRQYWRRPDPSTDLARSSAKDHDIRGCDCGHDGTR